MKWAVKHEKSLSMGYNMNTRMELKKEEKKKVILDAAEKIIAEKGFRAMTMDQVAKEADVAKGTLYLYFKNKSSLCAAVDTRINKEMNDVIKEKMDLCQTGSEKVVSSGTAVIEFSLKNPQKWNAGTELYQMKFEDPNDPNVLEFLHEVNNMIQMLAEAYRQGIDEGTIRKDLDPIPTAIYVRMAISNIFRPTPEQKMLLKLNNVTQKHYLSVAWSLINRSTHINPFVRADIENIVNNTNLINNMGKEIKKIAASMELQARDAIETFDAWETVNKIMVGRAEYETVKSTKDCVVVHITDCYVLNSDIDEDITVEQKVDNCSRYCTGVVETLNPKYTQKFTKRMCTGDPFCESIIELKK